jgi:hypothetical protein
MDKNKNNNLREVKDSVQGTDKNPKIRRREEKGCEIYEPPNASPQLRAQFPPERPPFQGLQ